MAHSEPSYFLSYICISLEYYSITPDPLWEKNIILFMHTPSPRTYFIYLLLTPTCLYWESYLIYVTEVMTKRHGRFAHCPSAFPHHYSPCAYLEEYPEMNPIHSNHLIFQYNQNWTAYLILKNNTSNLSEIQEKKVIIESSTSISVEVLVVYYNTYSHLWIIHSVTVIRQNSRVHRLASR